MDTKTFEKILYSRLDSVKKTLAKKAVESVKDNDSLHNCKLAAMELDISADQALLGLLAGNLVSIRDLVLYPVSRTEYLINEKIGNMLASLILLEAILKEAMSE